MSNSQKNGTNVVAVTGLHRGDSPQPGAAVIASLRRRFPQLRVVGFSYDPMESSIYSRGSDRLDAAYLLPYPAAGPEALLERLEVILNKENIGFLIPCLDSEISNFIRLQPRLLQRGIQCVLPTMQSFERRNKANLYSLCHRLGIPAPATRGAQDVHALECFAEEIGYPVYVKGKFYEAHLVNNKEELRNAYNEVVHIWGPPVLIQKPILGEEYDIVGLGDGKGAIVSHCTIRKMLRTPAGKGFAGVVVVDPCLDELAQRIIRSLRWDGPFELEFIKASGQPHALLEMNPRFPAWVDFPSQISCNFPTRLLERLLGLSETPLNPCPPGQMFIRHSIDLLGDIGDLAKMASAGERIDQSPKFEFEAQR